MQGLQQALGCSLWQLSLDLGAWNRDEDSTGRELLQKSLLWMVVLLKQGRGKLWFELPGCFRWEDIAQRGSRHTSQGQQKLTRQKTAIKVKGEKHERKATQALEKGEARQQQGLLAVSMMEHSAPPPTLRVRSFQL